MHQPNSPLAPDTSLEQSGASSAPDGSAAVIRRAGDVVHESVQRVTIGGEMMYGSGLKADRNVDRRSAEGAAMSEVIEAEALLGSLERMLIEAKKEPATALSVVEKGVAAEAKKYKEGVIASVTAVIEALRSMLTGLQKGTENLMPAAIQERLDGFEPVRKQLQDFLDAKAEKAQEQREESMRLKFLSLLQNVSQGRDLLRHLGLDWRGKELGRKEMKRLQELIVTGDGLRNHLKTISSDGAPILTPAAFPEGKPIVLLPEDIRKLGLMYYYPTGETEPRYLDPENITDALIVLYPEDLGAAARRPMPQNQAAA